MPRCWTSSAIWATWSEGAIRSQPIIVVSGLPRSGTSLMMQMLEAGGLEVVSDGRRRPDVDNPRGYFEDERAKRLGRDSSWLGQARGKAVKVVSALLYHLPDEWTYQTIFMERDLDEIVESQRAMLNRRDSHTGDRDATVLATKLGTHLAQVKAWLARQPNMGVLLVPYRGVIESPEAQAGRVREWVERPLDIVRMAQVVDPSLYRSRAVGNAGAAREGEPGGHDR